MPFGSLYFQEGLYFDCGICLQGFWAEEEVVGLACDENHVYHPNCLVKFLQSAQNYSADNQHKDSCNICGMIISIAEPDERERIDMGDAESENQSLTGGRSDYASSLADGPA